MTATAFLLLLTAFATITSLATEAVKKFLDAQGKKYAPNIIVLIIAFIVGCGGTAIYYASYAIPFNVLNSIYLVLMGMANWIGAMVGYDKIKEAVSQIGELGEK